MRSDRNANKHGFPLPCANAMRNGFERNGGINSPSMLTTRPENKIENLIIT
jgi:hypothetical protein